MKNKNTDISPRRHGERRFGTFRISKFEFRIFALCVSVVKILLLPTRLRSTILFGLALLVLLSLPVYVIATGGVFSLTKHGDPTTGVQRDTALPRGDCAQSPRGKAVSRCTPVVGSPCLVREKTPPVAMTRTGRDANIRAAIAHGINRRIAFA